MVYLANSFHNRYVDGDEVKHMSLYAIGDLHLHFQSELKTSGQLRDRVWKNHEEKFRRNCRKLITDEDTLVLAG